MEITAAIFQNISHSYVNIYAEVNSIVYISLIPAAHTNHKNGTGILNKKLVD